MEKKRTLTELVAELVLLRDSHGLKKIHNPKDLALALVVEASDILSHFQWKNPTEVKNYFKENKIELGEELVAVINYILLMSHDFGFDIEEMINEKIKNDSMKYPLKKGKINHISI